MKNKVFLLSIFTFLFTIIVINAKCNVFYKSSDNTSKGEKLSQTLNIINEFNSDVIDIQDTKSYLPFHPVKLEVFNNKVFYIYKGDLFRFDLNTQVNEIIKTNINKKEIINIQIDHNNNKLYLLDKSNDIYFYNLNDDKFINILPATSSKDLPDNHYSSFYFYDKSLFISDIAKNQIWNFSINGIKKLFSKDVPDWRLSKNDRDLTKVIDISKVNNKVFTLSRNGIFNVFDTNSINQFKTYNLIQKNYLSFKSENKTNKFYFLGGYSGIIDVFSENELKHLNSFVVLYQDMILPVYDISFNNNKLFILAGNKLFIHKKLDSYKKLENYYSQDFLKDYLSYIGIDDYKIPVNTPNIKLPNHSSLLPGARRVYRFGIHEGIDFFKDEQENIDISDKTHVISAYDGVIFRIDHGYKERNQTNHNKVLQECMLEHRTSSRNTDKLRGRQIWIKHKNNIITVYAHLSSTNLDLKIGDSVKKGTFLGTVGNSGTSDGVKKNKNGLHLHFEIHIDDKSKDLEYYLGKYLSLEETYQIFTKVFNYE